MTAGGGIMPELDDQSMREFVCEVCDRIETLTDKAAYEAGWDYPPFIGAFGIISPRTCPDCTVEKTVWYALAVQRIPGEQLTEKQVAVVQRILKEKENHGEHRPEEGPEPGTPEAPPPALDL